MRQLETLLKLISKDDLIICVELSRLDRNIFMIMEILNIYTTKDAVLIHRIKRVKQKFKDLLIEQL